MSNYVLFASANLKKMPQAAVELNLYLNRAMKNYRLESDNDQLKYSNETRKYTRKTKTKTHEGKFIGTFNPVNPLASGNPQPLGDNTLVTNLDDTQKPTKTTNTPKKVKEKGYKSPMEIWAESFRETDQNNNTPEPIHPPGNQLNYTHLWENMS